jgi:hypothetical protein
MSKENVFTWAFSSRPQLSDADFRCSAISGLSVCCLAVLHHSILDLAGQTQQSSNIDTVINPENVNEV